MSDKLHACHSGFMPESPADYIHMGMPEQVRHDTRIIICPKAVIKGKFRFKCIL